MKRIKIQFLFCCLFFSFEAMAGGGWTSKAGEGYFKLGQSAMYSDELFNKSGGRSDITTTGVYITSFYGEFGITDRWEGMVQLPLLFRMTTNEVRFRSGLDKIPGDELNFIGDQSLGIKYGVIKDKPFVVSVSMRFDLPLGETAGGDSKLLQSGDGEFNQLLKWEFGYGFKGNKVFMAGGVGYNKRSKNFSDEIHYNYEIGMKFTEQFIGIAKLRGIESTFNGDDVVNSNGIFSNNMELLTVSPQLAYLFKNNIGLETGLAYPLKGKNILADPVYMLGVVYKLSK